MSNLRADGDLCDEGDLRNVADLRLFHANSREVSVTDDTARNFSFFLSCSISAFLMTGSISCRALHNISLTRTVMSGTLLPSTTILRHCSV